MLDFIFDDAHVNKLQEYIETNFECQPCLVNNIITYVAAQSFGLDETIEILSMLLDGLGIEPAEIKQVITT